MVSASIPSPIDSNVEDDSRAGSSPAWRDEVSDRLKRYRSRRKVRPPRYPSLTLPFDAIVSPPSSNATEVSSQPVFETVSNHALALDEMRQVISTVEEAPSDLTAGLIAETESVRPPKSSPVRSNPPRSVSASAKIIEFPGYSWGPPVVPPDQLAEPVSERPRILDVPEVAPPPPALGGITIEAADRKQETNSGLEMSHPTAPLGLRIFAAAIDAIIVAAATVLFGFIFWKMAAVRPPLLQLLGLAAGVPVLFWAAYQYLMIVYAASTPGLRLAGLELSRFDGCSPTRSLRRWRVLASWLSAVSAGMGYAWVLLDERALCWHDRTTHTHFAQKKNRATVGPQNAT